MRVRTSASGEWRVADPDDVRVVKLLERFELADSRLVDASLGGTTQGVIVGSESLHPESEADDRVRPPQGRKRVQRRGASPVVGTLACFKRIFLMATISCVRLHLYLFTTPYVPSPRKPSFS